MYRVKYEGPFFWFSTFAINNSPPPPYKNPRSAPALDHGTTVTPSGLFPSVLQRPKGSFFAGILALWIALKITSFKRSCLAILPELLLQEKECRPFAFTNLAQVQIYGSQRFELRRRPIDILIALSESRKPMAVIGAAFS